MEYREEKRDLLTVSKDYVFVHCISADFALGAGIAKTLDEKYDIKHELYQRYDNYMDTYSKYLSDMGCEQVGDCLITTKNRVVYNLVTKKNYWNKPTLLSLHQALEKLKALMRLHDNNKVAMPLIGCGLDRLNWNDVSETIQDIFADTDIEILICKI